MSLLDLEKHRILSQAVEAWNILDAAAADIRRFEEFCAVLEAHDLKIIAQASPRMSCGQNVIYSITLTSFHAHQAEYLLTTLVAMGCSYRYHSRTPDGISVYKVSGGDANAAKQGAAEVPDFTVYLFPVKCAA